MSIKLDPVSKITKGKMAGRMAQVVEGLPSNCEAQVQSQYHKKKILITHCNFKNMQKPFL
jgi:hypothetical protein